MNSLLVHGFGNCCDEYMNGNIYHNSVTFWFLHQLSYVPFFFIAGSTQLSHTVKFFQGFCFPFTHLPSKATTRMWIIYYRILNHNWHLKCTLQQPHPGTWGFLPKRCLRWNIQRIHNRHLWLLDKSFVGTSLQDLVQIWTFCKRRICMWEPFRHVWSYATHTSLFQMNGKVEYLCAGMGDCRALIRSMSRNSVCFSLTFSCHWIGVKDPSPSSSSDFPAIWGRGSTTTSPQ